MRIGIGYDIHRLAAGRKLILGGVEIPYEKGLLGYSDSDVLLHAIIDALLGAAALGDIGQRFPDNDPAYKDISSLILLERTCDLVTKAGFTLYQLDSIIIAERPKLGPHMAQIKAKIGPILRIPPERIGVKAKTNEGLGPIGEGQAIAAQAVVLLDEEPKLPRVKD